MSTTTPQPGALPAPSQELVRLARIMSQVGYLAEQAYLIQDEAARLLGDLAPRLPDEERDAWWENVWVMNEAAELVMNEAAEKGEA